jgi:hypothetical protein
MPPSVKATVGERLYWSYANLAMAEMAVHEQCAKYSRKHFMIRARLYSGLGKGSMSPRSLMHDQRIRMSLPQECMYCGDAHSLTIDHVVPLNRGGADGGDNAVWACRRCNSSKSDKDLFAWWFERRAGFPPLFVVRIYLKQAIAHCIDKGIMACPWTDVQDRSFSFEHIPTNYPQPETLIFSPFHARKAPTQSQPG